MPQYHQANASVTAKDSGLIQRNFLAQQESQKRSETIFRRLEERGTTALYEAEGRYTVRSDGNAVRVPFAAMRQEGELMNLADRVPVSNQSEIKVSHIETDLPAASDPAMQILNLEKMF